MRDTLLASTNQLSFDCPVFGVETRMSACVKLREKVWEGQRPEVRGGCQAAMQCGKCPVAHLVQRTWQAPGTIYEGAYFSAEPKKGKLERWLLEAIQPVVMQGVIVQRYSVSPGEKERLTTANERIAKAIELAPEKVSGGRVTMHTSSGPATPRKRIEMSQTVPAPARVDDATLAAARTGDLAAALNKGAQA